MALSSFGRLFNYARESKVDALENFTTEALAAAIRADAQPMVRLLRSALLLPSGDDPISVTPMTQVGVRGTGILDLVLDVRYPGRSCELWVEVKVMAGESGQQLTNYRRYLADVPREVRPTLITLGRSRFGSDPGTPFLSWQSIWSASRAADVSEYWVDLGSFLEEIRMADTYDSPVSAKEAASLDDAASLLGKTRRILATATPAANERWPTFRWPIEEAKIGGVLADQFRHHRRYLIFAGLEYRAYLFMGVLSVGGEANVAVWVETRNKAIEPRRRIIERADSAGLSAEWQRDIGAWGGLHKTHRLVSFAAHDEVVDWILDSLAELDEAGILNLIPMLGQAEPAEAVDED